MKIVHSATNIILFFRENYFPSRLADENYSSIPLLCDEYYFKAGKEKIIFQRVTFIGCGRKNLYYVRERSQRSRGGRTRPIDGSRAAARARARCKQRLCVASFFLCVSDFSCVSLGYIDDMTEGELRRLIFLSFILFVIIKNYYSLSFILIFFIVFPQCRRRRRRSRRRLRRRCLPRRNKRD